MTKADERAAAWRLVAVVLLAASLGGCKADSSRSSGAMTGAIASQATSCRPAIVAGSSELSISGTPPVRVLVGNSYTFQPAAVTAAGSPLHFSALNLPAWASLELTTGRLTGTPDAAQIGTYSNIELTVSDGQHVATLPAFSIVVTDLAGGTVEMCWTLPVRNADGSALTDLAGYHIYYGTSANALDNVVTIPSPGTTNYVLDNLASGTWYFALRSYNRARVDSDLSPVIDTTI